MRRDPSRDAEGALKEIFKRMRPGDPINIEHAKLLIERNFFDSLRYDLGAVGRFKINERLGIDLPLTERTLNKVDLMEATKLLIQLRHTGGAVDDIDHLGNRRVRSVGELMENQYRMGLLRMERAIREKMSAEVLNNVKPQDLVNAKPIAAVISLNTEPGS